MTHTSLNRFKEILEKERNTLVANRTRRIAQDFLIDADDRKDEIDFMASLVQQNLHVRLQARESLFLKKIDAALQRISNGEYGECLECGDEIGERRLEIRPTTALCVHCQEWKERKETLFSNNSGMRGERAS